ncbi:MULTISPECIES: thioredoxin-dependent thiol peroxidase [Capnocytophaga]|uniref:thioredoxin-dependent thiol peroxidase n=1 Tax=Capnocytophaga TaxID=1016 RepID=UPI000BB1D926|nr:MULTISPECIES: thioredoxin-dependent thiol peroxidase [Capnocytophaga]ATA74261.1 thioredoxin-dependent thiol peroxidase [Capnocytophaga sp. H2931]
MNTVKKGDQIQDFQGTDQHGNVVKLSDFQGKKVIVFFYPKASTPGCTAEACSLESGYEILKQKGYALLGVSADSVKRQANFATKNKLSYPLIADEEKKIIQQFGVWGPKKFMGMEFDGIHRKTFVLNENHVVTHVIDKVKTKNHTEQLLEFLE